jgi:antitoxin FitA
MLRLLARQIPVLRRHVYCAIINAIKAFSLSCCLRRTAEVRIMGQILVRNLDDEIIERLKARAAREKNSLEQTVRQILADAAKPSKAEILAEIDRIRERQPKSTIDSTALIRSWRDGDGPDC